MKTIIIYDSKHGTTKKISHELSERIGKDSEVVHVKNVKNYNLRIFDGVIIGGSIHAGKIQSSIKRFCKENTDILKEKRLGLFISCMLDDVEKQKDQIRSAFSEDLIKSSVAFDILGGEFLFEKMNFVEKLMVKIIAKTNKSKSNINKSAIDSFVKKFVN